MLTCITYNERFIPPPKSLSFIPTSYTNQRLHILQSRYSQETFSFVWSILGRCDRLIWQEAGSYLLAGNEYPAGNDGLWLYCMTIFPSKLYTLTVVCCSSYSSYYITKCNTLITNKYLNHIRKQYNRKKEHNRNYR